MINRVLLVALVLTAAAQAQTYNNASLNSKYYFRELYFVTDATGNPTDVRSAVGTITYDGKGGYAISAYQNTGTAPTSLFSATGTYNINAGAVLTMTDPLKGSLNINGRFTTEAVFGSSSEASDNTFDFFIAVPEPAGGDSVKTLNSSYFVSTLELTGASAATARNAFLSIQPDGKGGIPGYTVRGHAANVNNGFPAKATPIGATYAVNSDGTGSINFGATDPTLYISGTKPIYVSKSGNIFIGGSTDPGVHDLVIGVKSIATSPVPPATSFNGAYFTSGLRLDALGQTSDCYTGALNSSGSGTALFTRRARQAGVPNTYSYTGSQAYAFNSDASIAAGDYTFGLGSAGMYVQSEASQIEYTSYEIGFGALYPAFSGNGVYISPYGIVNAASNAPGAPLSPGEFVTAFGANLATQTLQAGAPYPLTLGGVTVSVNNIPAPIYLISKNQINFLVPYGVTGSTASIVIKNSTGTSNTVTMQLATTSPGVYSVDYSGAGFGVILHADYSLVTTANPAHKGETVLMYLTGLGAVAPPVADGVAAPSTPLSNVVLTPQQLQVYISGMPAVTQFAGLAPGFPGLYQINVTIPTTIQTLNQVPVGINTPDAYHEQVYLFVQ